MHAVHTWANVKPHTGNGRTRQAALIMCRRALHGVIFCRRMNGKCKAATGTLGFSSTLPILLMEICLISLSFALNLHTYYEAGKHHRGLFLAGGRELSCSLWAYACSAGPQALRCARPPDANRPTPRYTSRSPITSYAYGRIFLPEEDRTEGCGSEHLCSCLPPAPPLPYAPRPRLISLIAQFLTAQNRPICASSTRLPLLPLCRPASKHCQCVILHQWPFADGDGAAFSWRSSSIHARWQSMPRCRSCRATGRANRQLQRHSSSPAR